MKVQVFNKSNNDLPQYAREGDAGLDLRADFRNNNYRLITNSTFLKENKGDDGYYENYEMHIEPGGRVLVPTGLHVSIPEGYEIQIRPRSGLALKHGITVLNSPGTVDSGFKDEIGVIIINNGNDSFVIKHGDRIAQAVLNKVEHIDWESVNSVEELEGSNRGGGFGSTKIK